MMLLLIGVVLTGASQDTLTFSLDQAVARGLAVSPIVAAADGAVAGPRGSRAEAFWPFPTNPALEVSRVRRSAPGATSLDRSLTIRQEIQIAGQNFLRASAAGWRIRSAEAIGVDSRRVTALQLRLAYSRLELSDRRAALMDTTARFAERLAEVVRIRLEAGAVNLLEHNAAVLEAARQRSAAERARAERAGAAAELAALLALPVEVQPRTGGLPALPTSPTPTMESLLARALAVRPDYLAAQATVSASKQALTAATLEGWVPNLVVGGIIAQEAGRDDLNGWSLGLSIPLFRRNQAGLGAARVDQSLAEADLVRTQRTIRAEVEAALARFTRAREAARRFAAEVLQAASENVRLSERAFEEGKVGIADVVVLRSTAIATQLEYLEVLADAYSGWFMLAAAIGDDPVALTDFAGDSQ